MMGYFSLLIFTFGCLIKLSSSGYCSYSTSCSTHATRHCGTWGWSRCTYTKYSTCYHQRCCGGWGGYHCSYPICSPSCLNGGTCTSPGTCKCDVYHSGGRCQTELAVCIPSCGSGGKCIGPNTCQCDIYHYGRLCQFKKSCTNKALELVFLLDSSGGIGKDNFETLKSFVKTVIEQFDIAGHKTRVGLMTFSRYPFMRFSINDNKSMSQLLQEVDNVPYISGLTETHTALQLLQQEGFLGSRSRVPHVALLITEGKSLHPNETKAVADAIRRQGIVMFVIAIGERVSRDELRIIATNPDDKHLFFVNNHTAIDGIKQNITTLICDVSSHVYTQQTTPKPVNITHTRRNPIDECDGKLADIVFLLDSSKSLGASHFKSVDHFALDIVNDLDIGLNATLVGVISFSTYPVRRVTLGSSSDKLELLNSINQILYYPGLRETDRALQMLRLEGFENDRPEAPNIAILITNGPSSNSFLTQRAANELKQSGVEVFTVGVGDDIEETELELISTSGGNHTFTAPNYLEFDLSSFEGIVASAVCQGLPVPTTPTTTTTTTTSTSRPTTRTTTYR
ncbi:cartilage matrix protein-like [Mercenaria mercenaria]|uniref:cartilage matrix protein-like n=1 Tax=Mercenaria mercenaria TaxID=6596 RepID=UPI00234E61E8|nr:cartilage matrix protein-like [Mercenaria mercenaria]